MIQSIEYLCKIKILKNEIIFTAKKKGVASR